ncbi:hypothetical protein PNOK_0636400 [Pyrrhoderma noxium]|uniref:Uncharacterized protein n=1 Tax=Pyrrhoderma noxium TaxID=2282107 RepID=A0A286UE99_9AGAM|nr:hypothetical protein PNOK_0636400 [Pyrrhoderma noxium]
MSQYFNPPKDTFKMISHETLYNLANSLGLCAVVVILAVSSTVTIGTDLIKPIQALICGFLLAAHGSSHFPPPLLYVLTS